MKRVVFILGALLALLLGGCVLSGKQQQKVSAAPVPPKPAATAPTTAPSLSPPLSIPQTVAELPPPQPISADALPTPKPADESVEAQPGPRPPPRRPGPIQGPPRVEPPVATPAQVQPPPGLPAPEQPERPPIQEILPPAEQKRLQESADTRKREIRKILDQAASRQLSGAQRDLVARIRTLVQQSDDAGTRNDWRQADQLAGQAQVLVRELLGGR